MCERACLAAHDPLACALRCGRCRAVWKKRKEDAGVHGCAFVRRGKGSETKSPSKEKRQRESSTRKEVRK